MKKRLLPIVYILIGCINVHADNYGLTFRADTNQDERTSLDLTYEKPINLSSGFSMSFDCKLRGVTYGYVFRMVANDNQSLDMVINARTKKINFVLTGIGGVVPNLEFESDTLPAKWSKIRVSVGDGSIKCSINDVEKEIPHSFENCKEIKVYFGKNGHPVFYTSDVSNMTIKNVLILNHKHMVVRNWKLSEHGLNEVYDETGNHRAVVENGIWEIDNNIKWTRQLSLIVQEINPQIASDSFHERVFVATSDSLFILDLKDHSVTRKKPLKGFPYKDGGGSQMIYDAKNDRLLSYHVKNTELIAYRFDKNEWSSDGVSNNELPFIQQHNRLIDKESKNLIVFGGYGNHIYKSTLRMHRLDSLNAGWETKDLSPQIAPRYLSAMGMSDSGKGYILGGYGNTSGRQEDSPLNLYDVCEIDFKDASCKQLMQIAPAPGHPVTFSNSLIVDEDKKEIYALAYHNNKYHSHIFLSRVDLKTREIMFYGDSIPYDFLDIESFCDLFKDARTSVFYAIVLQREKEQAFRISVYSLAYPPLKASNVLQKQVSGKAKRNDLLFILLLFIIVFAPLSYFLWKRNSGKKATAPLIAPEGNGQNDEETPVVQVKKTIRLLGGFHVFDKDGVDITDSFTPMLKQLFLFLLLNEIRSGERITSEMLDETFWYGMDKNNAINTRSVNIRKLRLLLERVGDITLSNKNSYWDIRFNEEISCDYKEVLLLLKALKECKTPDKALVKNVLDIAGGGLLLPHIFSEWVDEHKSKYSGLVIDALTGVLHHFMDDPQLQLKIADLILLHDNIDEEAVRVKCRILFNMGHKGPSKQNFDKYVQDYSRLLNVKPDIRYEEILPDAVLKK